MFPTNQTKQPSLALSWWLEVGTINPIGVRYFGPFMSKQEATAAKSEHLASLIQENVRVLFAQTRYCAPRQIFISSKELTLEDYQNCPPTLFEAVVGAL